MIRGAAHKPPLDCRNTTCRHPLRNQSQAGNLWLFGGVAGLLGRFNDLWRFVP